MRSALCWQSRLTLLTKALLIDIDPNTRWVNALIMSGQPGRREAEPPSAAEQVTEAAEEATLVDPVGEKAGRVARVEQ